MDIAVTALALGSAACFGLALVLTQLGLREVSPLRGASISVPVAALVFLTVSPAAFDAAGFEARSAVLFVLAGLLFPAAVTLLTFEANRHIGPNLTGALGNLTPAFAVAIAIALLGETPRSGQLAGIGVIIAGALLLVAGPRRGGARFVGWALALPLAAALIRGLVQPVVKLGLTGWPSPFAAALIGYVVSAVVILTAAWAKEGRLFGGGRGALWFVGVGVTNGLAVLTLYAALARGPVALVAPLVACYPLATLLFSLALRGTADLSWRVALGVAVTVAGVGLLLRA